METVHYADKILRAPKDVLMLAVDGWQELLRKDHCGTNGCLVQWDQKVAWIEEGGRVAGLILYAIEDYTGSVWVMMAYTDPQKRRSRLLSTLWYQLSEKLKAEGIKKVRTGVATGNEASLGACAKFGLHATGITMEGLL